jgi:GntR family transcriptional regulator
VHTVYTVNTDQHSDIVISQTDPRPMYQQVKDQMRHRVAVGELKPGDEIPSIRALAASSRVSVITIKRAYLELEMEGVIQTRQGRGSFVADNVNLGGELRDKELDEQLAAAVRTAAMLGITDEALVERLRQVERNLNKRES